MALIRIGTRKSKLALWQTDHVIERLHGAWPDVVCEKVLFTTQGDKNLDKPLPAIGGKGLFTLELEEALRREEIDLAVHSLKDLPVEQPDDLILGAILGRADVRDVLIAKNQWTLATLPMGAVVGTSSLRRQAQLLAARPDLTIESIRGNVETRIHKALESDDYDAAILAAAGVIRLGLEAHITDWLPLEVMLPAPGQGALAVQCRHSDKRTRDLLAAIENPEVLEAITAERTFLNALGGGCATPVAAYALSEQETILLRAIVASTDGQRRIELSAAGSEPIALGQALAEEALVRGAASILKGQPLAGKRVLVTRSRQQAADFASRLREVGAVPVVFPVIAFESLPTQPLVNALGKVHTYDWLIFTSVNAVDFFMAAYRQQQLPHVAAVGSATLTKLEEEGIQVDFVPDIFTGKELARGLGDLDGQRILLPRARIGRPEIVDELRAQGADVEEIALYDTVPTPPSEETIMELEKGVDVITFTSPSSVRNFLGHAGNKAVSSLLRSAVIACIGPSTAEEAEANGLAVAVIPDEYTIGGLIKGIEEHYAQPGAG